MSMITFSYLNKAEKHTWLPQLFDLLYDNMRTIAPSGLSYAEEKAQWLANVSPALDKAPRQINLCFVDGMLAGYIQYYTRGRLLMVEEIQIKKVHQRTTVFYSFVRYLRSILPKDIAYIEAYADKRNQNSHRIMKKLGMTVTESDPGAAFLHFQGTSEVFNSLFSGHTETAQNQR